MKEKWFCKFCKVVKDGVESKFLKHADRANCHRCQLSKGSAFGGHVPLRTPSERTPAALQARNKLDNNLHKKCQALEE